MNLLQRQDDDLLTCHIELLREVVKKVRQRHPFIIHGWVVLPEHLHCVIELPANDADFATRWRLIKIAFQKDCPLPSGAHGFVWLAVSEAYGNAVIGSI